MGMNLNIEGEHKQRFWALTDQGVVSLGNFLTTLLMARYLPASEFGIYSLLFSTILLLNALHSALVTVPVLIRGAAMSSRELRQWTSAAVLATVVFATVFGAVATAATRMTGRLQLSFIVVAAMIAWQLQATSRSAFCAHVRQRQALPGDALSYLGQAAMLFFLARRGALTVGMAFGVIAITSGAAFALQAIQLRLSAQNRIAWRPFKEAAWKLGSWGLPAQIVSLFALQPFPWVLFFNYGPAAAGVFQALCSAMGFCNPVMVGTGNLVVATVARSEDKGRFRNAVAHALHGWAIIAPGLLLVLLFPAGTLHLLFGSHPEYLTETSALRLVALAFGFDAIAILAGAAIGAMEEMRSVFVIQAAAMAAAVVLGFPLAILYGVRGAAAGYLGVQVLRALYGAWILSGRCAAERISREESVTAAEASAVRSLS
jgi:O-antigen/teichoic acid export membrane protein